MIKKQVRPNPGTFEHARLCWGKNPKPAWHLKECVRCAKEKADEEHYWKWRIKTRAESPCHSIVCKDCGWPHEKHGKLAQKQLA